MKKLLKILKMVFKYFTIWFKVVKKYATIKYSLISIATLFISFISFYLLFSKNIINGLLFLIILIDVILTIRFVLNYNKIVSFGLYDSLKLKPLDPIFTLLIYNRNPLDIFILFPILIYLKIINYKF